MNKTEFEKIKEEINFLADPANRDEEYKKQQTKREAYQNAPENHETLAKVRAKMRTAQLVYNIRKKAHLTQKELAEKLHMKQPSLARIERGQNTSLEMLYKIADACNATIDIKAHFNK